MSASSGSTITTCSTPLVRLMAGRCGRIFALLFSLSLVPFVIRWIDEGGFVALPTAAYGVVLAMAAVSYTLLQAALIARNGHDSELAKAVGHDIKGKLSLAAYVVAIPLAFVSVWIAIALYVMVAMIWFVPDSRIESNHHSE